MGLNELAEIAHLSGFCKSQMRHPYRREVKDRPELTCLLLMVKAQKLNISKSMIKPGILFAKC